MTTTAEYAFHRTTRPLSMCGFAMPTATSAESAKHLSGAFRRRRYVVAALVAASLAVGGVALHSANGAMRGGAAVITNSAHSVSADSPVSREFAPRTTPSATVTAADAGSPSAAAVAPDGAADATGRLVGP